MRTLQLSSSSLGLLLLCASAHAQSQDPLPSWNDAAAKKAIVRFVEGATREDSAAFVPTGERVAVFDNDGTLWAEQPMYTQLVFALDRVKALAPEHPEWRERQPFKAAIEGDLATLEGGVERAMAELMMATHAGNTVEEFAGYVKQWLATATHPRTGRRYTDMVYQPMLELLAYLRGHGFKTYVVTGGGIEFVRAFSERVYGIPPEQVIGSSIETTFELRGDKPSLVRRAAVDFIDDGPGKPVGIQQHIGRRPLAAFGNADGDLQMLQWATLGRKAGFALLVHHTDAKREWAYDRKTRVGRLDEALDEAKKRGWTVVDMRKDWKVVYAEPLVHSASRSEAVTNGP